MRDPYAYFCFFPAITLTLPNKRSDCTNLVPHHRTTPPAHEQNNNIIADLGALSITKKVDGVVALMTRTAHFRDLLNMTTSST